MYLARFDLSRILLLCVVVFQTLHKGQSSTIIRNLTSIPVCDENAVLYCDIGEPFDSTKLRLWTKDGGALTITDTSKYEEGLNGAVQYFNLTIKGFTNATDAGSYECSYGFTPSPNSILVFCQVPTTESSTTTTTTTTTPATTSVTANTTTTTSSSGSTSFSAVPENSYNTDTTPTASPGKNADHIIVLIAVVSSVGGVFLLGIAGTIILLCRKRTRRRKHQENNGMTSERRSRDIQNQHVQMRTHHF